MSRITIGTSIILVLEELTRRLWSIWWLSRHSLISLASGSRHGIVGVQLVGHTGAVKVVGNFGSEKFQVSWTSDLKGFRYRLVGIENPVGH